MAAACLTARVTRGPYCPALPPSCQLQEATSGKLNPLRKVNLGNINSLSGQTVSFELSYDPRAGYSYTLATSAGENVLQFTPADNAFNGVFFNSFHNAISVKIAARYPNPADSATSDQNNEAVLTNTVFTITDSLDPVIECGSSLLDSTVSTSGTKPDTVSARSAVEEPWIVADRDLSHSSWTLTGNIQLSRTLTGDSTIDDAGDNLVQLQIRSAEISSIEAAALTRDCPSTCVAFVPVNRVAKKSAKRAPSTFKVSLRVITVQACC